VVVLNEVDLLTRDAQNALRRTMEKVSGLRERGVVLPGSQYMATCRLILCCNSSTRVIEPLRSRCLSIRIPAPSSAEVADVLAAVCRKEHMALPAELARRIADEADGSLRRALLLLEASKAAQCAQSGRSQRGVGEGEAGTDTQLHSFPFSPDSPVQRMDWEVYTAEIANDLLAEQSPAWCVATASCLCVSSCG
jgi:replication factor C subunit 3/5